MNRFVLAALAATTVFMTANLATAENSYFAVAQPRIADNFKANRNLEGGSYKVCGTVDSLLIEERFTALGAEIQYVKQKDESELGYLVEGGICDVSVFDLTSPNVDKMKKRYRDFWFEF